MCIRRLLALFLNCILFSQVILRFRANHGAVQPVRALFTTVAYNVHLHWFAGKKSFRILRSWNRGPSLVIPKPQHMSKFFCRLILTSFFFFLDISLLTKMFILFFFWKIALLDSTSLKKFKTYQPEELLVWNISPLMETCFLLLATLLGTLKDTRQVPWSTRWTTQLEDFLSTRPCRQEERMAWSTFLSLTSISLLSLIITIEHTGWTLQSTNGMENCLSTFRNYQQTEQSTSPFLR